MGDCHGHGTHVAAIIGGRLRLLAVLQGLLNVHMRFAYLSVLLCAWLMWLHVIMVGCDSRGTDILLQATPLVWRRTSLCMLSACWTARARQWCQLCSRWAGVCEKFARCIQLVGCRPTCNLLMAGLHCIGRCYQHVCACMTWYSPQAQHTARPLAVLPVGQLHTCRQPGEPSWICCMPTNRPWSGWAPTTSHLQWSTCPSRAATALSSTRPQISSSRPTCCLWWCQQVSGSCVPWLLQASNRAHELCVWPAVYLQPTHSP